MYINNILYNFNDIYYFGIHYAIFNSFKVKNITTNTTYIVNEGEFFLSKNASDYTIESTDDNYTSVATLLVNQAYLNFLKGHEVLGQSVLDSFLENPNTPFLITDFSNTSRKDMRNITEIFNLFAEKTTAPALTNHIFLESLVKKVLIYTIIVKDYNIMMRADNF